MTSPLLISLVSCLVAVNQASLIGRCDLAKVLYQEDLDGFEGYSLTDWLCLAFVESDFNITKVNENTDGSFDYGIFQINSHYWCNDYQSHTENICQVDCQATPNLQQPLYGCPDGPLCLASTGSSQPLGGRCLARRASFGDCPRRFHRTAEPQSSCNY